MLSPASWTEHTVAEAGGAAYIAPRPEPSGARVWFFTRKGGVSESPYHSLNISALVGDDDEAVAENRARVRVAMENRPSAWVRQVAGDRIITVEHPGFAGEGDALITGGKGYALVVAIADCIPVALVGDGVVAMVHSGWRGTWAGIAGKAARMVDGEAQAYMGPGIRECCYEVSHELAAQFAGKFGTEVVSGRYLSLPGAIRADLEEAGVWQVHDLGLCTGCRPDLFYSHRKLGPKTGRNLAAVALR